MVSIQVEFSFSKRSILAGIYRITKDSIEIKEMSNEYLETVMSLLHYWVVRSVVAKVGQHWQPGSDRMTY